MLSPPAEDTNVPSAARRWREAVEGYANERAREFLTQRHLREMKRVLARIGELLERRGIATSPEAFNDTHLNLLVADEWRGLANRTKAYNVCLVNQFLKSRGNTLIETRRLHFPSEKTRPTEAFSPEEADRILGASRNRGIVAEIGIALELTMGLRRSEVLRLKASDFESRKVGFLTVLGKGRLGGKRRDVPISSRVKRLLPEALAHRSTVVAGLADPGYLLCHVWKGTVRAFSPATFDRFYIGPTFRDAGLYRRWQLNHALRRTFGRTLYQRHVPIEKIAVLLGHEDTRTTMRYLGINDDDKLAAMREIDEVYG